MDLSINIAEEINELFRQINLSLDPIVGQIIAALIFFALSIICGWVVYHVFEHYFSRWAEKTKTTIDDEVIRNVKKPIYYLVILIGFYFGVDQITSLDAYTSLVTQIFLIFEILLIAFIITRVINVFVSWYAEKNKKKGKAVSTNILVVFKKALHAVVYIFAFLMILYINEIDLSGVVVGLGVGGIAIAFALQSILSDAFSAFSIYFDRPFEIGDFIIVGEFAGTVTHISMKSTRIKLLHGEELILSNKEITASSVRNFKKMKHRRVEFTIGVTYDTPTDKLKKIPEIVKNIIEKTEKTELVGVYFKEFASFSLNFKVIYYTKTADYLRYLQLQHDMNITLKETFEKEGIEFAFPTQTIILNKNNQ
jgi:small-conductance mechanosensitive channel